jgi:hypothetical protein
MGTRRTFLVALTVALATVLSVLTPTAATADGYNEVLIQNADGRWERFWVNDGNRSLMHRWQRADGTWSGEASLGGVLLYDKIDVGRNADGRLEAFGIGQDRQMFHIWQQSAGGWSGWSAMGGQFIDAPYIGYTSYGGIILYGRGLDAQRFRKHQTAPSCCWTSAWVHG